MARSLITSTPTSSSLNTKCDLFFLIKSQTGDEHATAPCAEDKANLVLHFIKSKLPAAALCRKHRISQSNYYSWRKIFVLAGTQYARRTRKRASQIPVRMLTKANEDRAARNAEKMRLQRSIEAVLAPRIDRRARLTEATKRTIVDLIETASISKSSALAVAGVARGTYYRCRKIMLMNVSPQEHQSRSKYIKLEDRECLKDAVFKLLHRHWTTGSTAQYGKSTTCRKVWSKQA